jgi:hypothetical protein
VARAREPELGAGDDTDAWDNGVVPLVDDAGVEEVGVAEGRDALPILPLALFALEPERSPKIDGATSKSAAVSIMLSNDPAKAAASLGGKGVPSSLSSDHWSLSEGILLIVQLNH